MNSESNNDGVVGGQFDYVNPKKLPVRVSGYYSFSLALLVTAVISFYSGMFLEFLVGTFGALLFGLGYKFIASDSSKLYVVSTPLLLIGLGVFVAAFPLLYMNNGFSLTLIAKSTVLLFLVLTPPSILWNVVSPAGYPERKIGSKKLLVSVIYAQKGTVGVFVLSGGLTILANSDWDWFFRILHLISGVSSAGKNITAVTVVLEVLIFLLLMRYTLNNLPWGYIQYHYDSDFLRKLENWRKDTDFDSFSVIYAALSILFLSSLFYIFLSKSYYVPLILEGMIDTLSEPLFRKILFWPILVLSAYLTTYISYRFIRKRHPFQIFTPLSGATMIAGLILFIYALPDGLYQQYTPNTILDLISTYGELPIISVIMFFALMIPTTVLLLFKIPVTLKIIPEKASGIAVGSSSLFIASILSAFIGIPHILSIVGVTSSLVVWGIGENSVSLGKQIGRQGNTLKSEVVNVISTSGMGIIAIVSAILVSNIPSSNWRFTNPYRPLLALVLLMFAAAILITSLRSESI